MNTSENNAIQVIETNDKFPQMRSLRVIVEKLDGGFISDVEGKRKIYKDTEDIIDAIGVNKLLNKIESNEYKLNIDLIPKDEYTDYIDALEFGAQAKRQENLILEDLLVKEPYNPFPNAPKNEPQKEIKIDGTNCYNATRLKSIDWKKYNEELELSGEEKANIAGVGKASMYFMWNNAVKGKATYQVKSTRIAMTILAKYYESNLGIRSSTKEKIDLLKEQMLKGIREIELLMDKKSHVKTSDVSKKLIEMRKTLMD